MRPCNGFTITHTSGSESIVGANDNKPSRPAMFATLSGFAWNRSLNVSHVSQIHTQVSRQHRVGSHRRIRPARFAYADIYRLPKTQ